jgi:quinol monooxygenase YgiN
VKHGRPRLASRAGRKPVRFARQLKARAPTGIVGAATPPPHRQRPACGCHTPEQETAMTPGCTLVAMLHARPEKRDDLIAVLQDFVAPTRKEAGCVDYHLHVDETDPNLFWFYENWRSRADLDLHLTLPHLAALGARGDELLAKPVEIRFLRMLSPWPGG